MIDIQECVIFCFFFFTFLDLPSTALSVEQHFPSFEKRIVEKAYAFLKERMHLWYLEDVFFFFFLDYLDLYELLKLLFLGKKFFFPSAMILPIL